jgi:ribosomal protein L37AE/L43A
MTRPFNNSECCFVCRRRAAGIGVGKPGQQGWLCMTCDINLAKEAYHMSGRDFDVFERRALKAAGETAGAYLDEIGKTDLASLDEAQWLHFLERVVTAFGDAVRAEVQSGKAPF